MAPAVAWYTVTGPFAFSCLALFTLGFWTLLLRARVSGQRLPRSFGVNPRLPLEEFQLSFGDFARTVRTGGVWLGRGPRHASAYGCSSKNFLSFALALFALGIWCIVSVDRVPGSHCSGRLGVAFEHGKLDFTGDVCFPGCNTWFDSGYLFCDSTLVAVDELRTISTLRRCSPFCCRTEKRAQSMLVVAVLLCAVRTWKTGSTFLSFTWLSCVMTDRVFRRSVRHFSASSLELRPLVTGSCQFISTSCGHTHPVSEHASETTTTTTTPTPRWLALLSWAGGGSVASQVPTLVGDLAGESKSQPEPCTE